MAKLKKISDEEYEIIDRGDDNFHHILLKEDSPYPSVEYQYGAVKLREENEALRVSFEYEVFSNPKMLDTKSSKFVEYIGNILVTNLEEILLYNKYQKSGA